MISLLKPTVYAGSSDEMARPAASDLRMAYRIDGQLWAEHGAEHTAVTVQRCFPWSAPQRFVSLRDRDDHEVALIPDPARLDRESREALERALVEAGFVLQVERIREVDEEVEIRTWRVETRQGPRTFQTRLDDWPRELPGGGVLIRDVAGDLYHVTDREALDAKSRRLLWAFAD